MNLQRQLESALSHHQAGHLTEAERIYRQILASDPNQVDALHLLGTLAGQMGYREAALELIGRAVRLKPDYAEAHANMANSLKCMGRADEAIAAYREAIRLKPDLAEAHGKLGDLLTQTDLVDEAAAVYRRYFECLWSISKLVRNPQRKDEGITQYLRAIGYSKGRARENLTAGPAATAIESPKSGPGDGRSVSQMSNETLDIHAIMANTLAAMKRLDEAEAAHSCAAIVAPQSSATHVAMGQILNQRGDTVGAVDCFERARNLDPGSPAALHYLGVAYRAVGRFEESAACFEELAKIRPDLVMTYTNLASMGKLKGDQPEISELLSQLDQTGISAANRIAVGFALGRAFDAAGRFDEAFNHYAAANSLARQQRAEAGEIYDPGVIDEQIGRLIDAFWAEYFRKRMDWGEASELPVFVCGMPRSGTTLVQQIAASHPQIHAAGELRDIAEIARRLEGVDLPAKAQRCTADQIRIAAQEHVRKLRELDPRALRVIDKMPGNVYRLGLIRLLFPSARIVLCRRDPRDCCLSCYFQWFAEGNVFSFDLGHCGNEHRVVDRVMAHWRQVLPLRILEVQYEDIVADLEGQSRRLIDFLGLPWDPACLEFHRTPATIQTASVWQVRQPLYDRSVGRWRHYEKHLGPLFDALNRP